MSVSTYQNNITQLTKDKADLQRQLGQERAKLLRLSSDISNIKRSINKFTSTSSLNSKQRQIESKEKDAVQVQKKIADIEAKISKKIEGISRNTSFLEKNQAQLTKIKIFAQKKQRNEELRHMREITRENEKQASIQAELRRSPLMIDLSKLPVKIKVLFFAANPQDQNQLRLYEEIRAITEKIRASEHRDSVEIISRWAVRPPDLLQALNEHRPHIVHFSGHGSDTEQIIFLDSSGNTKPVSKTAIVELMNTMADNIQVVIFNTCFSSGQAEAVTQNVDVAIGMNTSIGDGAARIFSAQFYSAIGFGRSVQNAFNQAKAALMLEGILEEKTPELFTREGITADQVILVRPTGV